MGFFRGDPIPVDRETRRRRLNGLFAFDLLDMISLRFGSVDVLNNGH